MADNEMDDVSSKGPSSGVSAALDGIGGLSVFRQIGLMVGLAASVAIGLGIVLWSQEPAYKPLYTDISHLEAGQVSRLLDQEQIRYKVDTDKGLLLVDGSQIHQARIALAEEGFSTGKTMGYELLDKEQPFGTSQFMEKARYHRSIEGELANTIASMHRVRNARVHLAIPKRSVFVNDRRRPSASVFIEIYRGQSLDKAQVAAIVHLVSSSIPEMREDDVSVVDQRGTLLTEKDQNSEIAMAAKQLDYTRKLEARMMDRIANILEPIVGRDGYKVQVAADLDFSARQQAAESFNPDLSAVRSEQTMNEYSDRGAAQGIPGALSNQPPGAGTVPEEAGGAAAEAAEAQGGNVRRQATRNFEVDRTVTHTRHQVGSINRLSVAVVLDDRWAMVKKPGAEEGSEEMVREKQPLSEVEIERINQLVRNAMGFNAARGDSVSVVNQAFNTLSEEAPEMPPEEWWKETWVMDYARLGVGFFLLVILFFGVLRPMFKRLVESGSEDLTALPGAEGGDLGLGFDDDNPEGQEGASVTFSGEPSSLLLPGPDNNYEANLDSVRGLAAEDPKRVAQAIKLWLNNE